MNREEGRFLLGLVVVAASFGAWAWAISLILAGVVIAGVTSAGWLK